MKNVTSLAALLFAWLVCNAQNAPTELKASVLKGLAIYQSNCITCHMEAGDGLEGVYPPLAKSDYLMADKKRTITQIMTGLSGPIKVKGIAYDGEMTAIDLSDQDIADVVNYIRNSWGNKGEAVSTDDVKGLRKKL